MYLTGILLAYFRIPSAHHVLGYHFRRIVCVPALFIADNRNFHFLKQTGRLSVFLQRAPTGGDTNSAHVQIICNDLCIWSNTDFTLIKKFVVSIPLTVGRQMGRMLSVIGTRSFSRNRAISLSKLRKLKEPAMALKTNRDSGRIASLHRSCSPNVTLIMNHMNLRKKNEARREIYASISPRKSTARQRSIPDRRKNVIKLSYDRLYRKMCLFMKVSWWSKATIARKRFLLQRPLAREI